MTRSPLWCCTSVIWSSTLIHPSSSLSIGPARTWPTETTRHRNAFSPFSRGFLINLEDQIPGGGCTKDTLRSSSCVTTNDWNKIDIHIVQTHILNSIWTLQLAIIPWFSHGPPASFVFRVIECLSWSVCVCFCVYSVFIQFMCILFIWWFFVCLFFFPFPPFFPPILVCFPGLIPIFQQHHQLRTVYIHFRNDLHFQPGLTLSTQSLPWWLLQGKPHSSLSWHLLTGVTGTRWLWSITQRYTAR